MSNPNPLLQLTIFFGLLTILVYAVGEYLAWMYRTEANSAARLPRHFTWFDRLDRIFIPMENSLYRVTGIDPTREMDWRGFLVSVIVFNALIWILLYLVLFFQKWLPINPLNLSGQDWDLAFHTASSFVTNTNQQHYNGESLSTFTNIFAIGIAMFLTPATGLALMPAFARGFTNDENSNLGNFYVNTIKGLVRFLLPVSLLLAIILIWQGAPQVISGGKLVVSPIDGGTQNIRVGVVAGIEAIKMWGTNGGGIMGANAAHPFENPTPISNLLLTLAMPISTFCAIYAWGVWVGRREHGILLVAVFAIIYFSFTGVAVISELNANPGMDVTAGGLSVNQYVGNMEGKEVRFGPTESALWGSTTTSTTNGGVNSMLDSWNPLGGIALLFAFATNNVSNGVGTGLLNILMFVIVSVFIGGLMIGRRPQYLGKKLEWQEMRYVFLVILLLPALVLIPLAIAIVTDVGREAISNPGFHGFSQVLYEMFSASANNGSGFEGLASDTVFYNLVNGIETLLGRYVTIGAQLAIAGYLAEKKTRPETEGSLDIESVSFFILTVAIVIIIGALTFLPALVFGPIGELLSGGI